MGNPLSFARSSRPLPWWRLLTFALFPIAAYSSALVVENANLLVSLETTNAAISVTDKVTASVWTQAVLPGYAVANSNVAGNAITATVRGPNSAVYNMVVTLSGAKSFDLVLSIPAATTGYTYLPSYPFRFAQSNAGGPWYYAQNTGGEGVLLPLSAPQNIRALGGWTGSQPWWGITNLNEAMMARLDTFALQQNPQSNGRDLSAYGLPMRINYSFFSSGGYVGLAKAFRQYVLSHNTLATLNQRAATSPSLAHFKNGTYAYFWDDNPANTISLISTLKAAGIDRMIAMFYLHDDEARVNASVYNAIASQGWLGGLYRIPTPNLFNVCTINDWVRKLLTGEITEAQVLQNSARPPLWSKLYTTATAPAWKNTDVPSLLATYGGNLKVIYHDTLPQQLGPCIDDANGYRESVETNLAGRQAILDGTRGNRLIAGAGEGIAASWTIPHVDYWEGGMEDSIYADIPSHPAADHDKDFGTSYSSDAAAALDETVRVPLLALGFHDYVVETWNWRNTTFVDGPLAWKKELFNILYGALPNWNMDQSLWAAHASTYLASYQKLFAVRNVIGFAEMLNHGWLTADKSVQYTDWDTGNRVIVNFGSSSYVYNPGNVTVPSHGYVLLDTQPTPVFSRQPSASTMTVAAGSTVVLSVAATGTPPPSYQWQRDGFDISGATTSSLVLSGATGTRATVPGNYRVVATNSAGSTTSTATPIEVINTDDPGRLINLSILTPLGAGEKMTMGTILGGAGTSGLKPVLARAVGQSLTLFGINSFLPNPAMTLNFTTPTPAVVVATNTGWGGSAALSDAFASVAAFGYVSPTSTDSAIFRPSLAPGNYTVEVKDAAAGSGTVIAEIYDTTPSRSFSPSTPRLINVSVLKQINAGDTLTAGFVIGGSTWRTLLIRAIGPRLGQAPFSIGGAMPAPTMTLINASIHTTVATNGGWGGDPTLAQAASNVGAFAVTDGSSKDAMLLVTLPPANYTVQVSPASGNAGGMAIVEIYEVP